MIAGIGISKLAGAYMLAALSTCPAFPPVEHVEMEFINKPPNITNDQPSESLGQFSVSTTFSHSNNETFTVGGLHLADFAPKYLIGFTLMNGLEDGKVCLAPASVKISVEYAPLIMIASEYTPGTCRYKTIIGHEMRHVGIDISSLNEYLPKIQQAMQEAVAAIKPIGPMPPASLEKAKDIMTDAVRAALIQQVDEFEIVRFNRQQLLDTRQEYLRGSRACDGQP